MTDRPLLLIVAGPNGSGKTTFAKRQLHLYSHRLRFVNTDEIAQRLSPLDVNLAAVRAAREALNRMRGLLHDERSFAIETTLSGASQYRLAQRAVAAGWKVDLAYLWIECVELAKRRVSDRVKLGGHFVPAKDIERRYERSLRNLPKFIDLCDETAIYDNREEQPKLIASYKDSEIIIYDEEQLDRIEAAVGR